MPTPHARWAHLYDHAYHHSFGAQYRALSEQTLNLVRTLGSPPCSVIDFGAGTGRIAVPLARAGYAVTAVDPCAEMLAVLRAKAADARVAIDVHEARMEDFEDARRFDVALCVFTTVLYLLDESSLRRGLRAFAASLRPGGRLLFDVPSRLAFQGFRIATADCVRSVDVAPIDDDRYTYTEDLRCRIDGVWQACTESFPIRYWPVETVLDVLSEAGVACDGPIDAFAGTGSDYFTGRRLAR
jgi:SAM-dependent methyltransferase